MLSTDDMLKFNEEDWGQFDFSRWHLDGLPAESDSAAFLDLAQKLFQSPEWQENFKTSLPQLQSQLLKAYKDDSKQLEAQRTSADQDFDQRVTNTKESNANLAKAIEAAAAPIVLQPVDGVYQISAKVTDADGHLGLPGLIVQIMDPRRPKSALVAAVTDVDGNAVLTVPEDAVKEIEGKNSDFQVLDGAGKVIHKIAGAASIRSSQIETRVIPLADSAATKVSKAAALDTRSRREVEARIVAAKVDALTQARDSRLRDLDSRLEQNQAIIDAPQSSSSPSTRGEDTNVKNGEPSPQNEPAKTDASRRRKGRWKK